MDQDLTPTIEDTIYFAGFFDGEGCVSISCRSPKWDKAIRIPQTLVLSISNTNRDIIHWIHTRFGGSVHEVRNTAKSRRTMNYAKQWHWRAQSKFALCVLDSIRPYLRVKAIEADIGAAFQRRITDRTVVRAKSNVRGSIRMGSEEIAERVRLLSALRDARKRKKIPYDVIETQSRGLFGKGIQPSENHGGKFKQELIIRNYSAGDVAITFPMRGKEVVRPDSINQDVWHALSPAMKRALGAVEKKPKKDVRGEGNYCSKITEENVRQIRAEYVPHKYGSATTLARKFGVHPSTIVNAATGKKWKHVI